MAALMRKALIAIVDDDAPLRAALDNLIRSDGYSTVQYADAESFLDRPACQVIDLLISDYQMPGLNGLELLKMLRNRGATFPVILMTALGFDQLAPSVKAEGAFICLQKPFDEATLFAAINGALVDI